MPVGTGSLQRAAAKASGAAEGQKKGRAKSTAVKEAAAKQETAPKADAVYHLTEELPYYLL